MPNIGIMTMLLMDQQVSAELKVTQDQKNQITDLGGTVGVKMQDAMRDVGSDPDKAQAAMQMVFEDVGKKQMAVLTAGQQKRLKEIYVQDNGFGSALSKDVQMDLGLKDDQTKKVAALQDSLMKATTELGQKLQAQEIDYQMFRDLSDKNQKILTVELGKVLTDDQKKKLKEMEGKPFQRKAPGGDGPPPAAL